MKAALIAMRMAFVAIAIDFAESGIRHNRRRLERLTRREIDLRIEYSRAKPIRSIVYPGA